jgi:choline dehydrogenase-like flavoprotein
VLFQGGKTGGYVAKGVELETSKGELLEARLKAPGKGSVVLTAGALNTPKILMNSGVGDPAKLKAAGIPVMNELPGVGKNLQDHPVIPLTFQLAPDLAARVAEAFGGGGFEELSNYAEWVRSGGGLLKRNSGTDGGTVGAATAGAPLAHNFPPKPQTPYLVFASTSFTAGAFLKSDKGSKNPKLQDEYPDIQLTVFPRVTEPHLVARKKASQDATAATNTTTNGTAGAGAGAGADADADDAASAGDAAAAAAAEAEAADDRDMLVTVALLDPEARYEILLAEGDPARGPVRLHEIHFPEAEGGGLLSVGDAAKLVWGLRQVRVIAKTYPLNQVSEQMRRQEDDGRMCVCVCVCWGSGVIIRVSFLPYLYPPSLEPPTPLWYPTTPPRPPRRRRRRVLTWWTKRR